MFDKSSEKQSSFVVVVGVLFGADRLRSISLEFDPLIISDAAIGVEWLVGEEVLSGMMRSSLCIICETCDLISDISVFTELASGSIEVDSCWLAFHVLKAEKHSLHIHTISLDNARNLSLLISMQPMWNELPQGPAHTAYMPNSVYMHMAHFLQYTSLSHLDE